MNPAEKVYHDAAAQHCRESGSSSHQINDSAEAISMQGPRIVGMSSGGSQEVNQKSTGNLSETAQEVELIPIHLHGTPGALVREKMDDNAWEGSFSGSEGDVQVTLTPVQRLLTSVMECVSLEVYPPASY